MAVVKLKSEFESLTPDIICSLPIPDVKTKPSKIFNSEARIITLLLYNIYVGDTVRITGKLNANDRRLISEVSEMRTGKITKIFFYEGVDAILCETNNFTYPPYALEKVERGTQNE